MSRYTFAPKWLPSILTMLLLPLLISLGIWQLHRADFKRELQARYQQRQSATPLKLQQLDKVKLQTTGLQQIAYHPIEITGRFDHDHTILLDNKIHQHQVGYHVITPFLPTHGGSAVLINRGFIPREKSLAQLPTIPREEKTLRLKGIIYLPPDKPFMLGKNIAQAQATWPLLVQQIDIAMLSSQLHYSLYPFVVLLDKDQAFGFVRHWEPVQTNPAMHLGYAFQWFALAVTLIICFIVISTHRKKL